MEIFDYLRLLSAIVVGGGALLLVLGLVIGEMKDVYDSAHKRR
jgi:hypothetical protein